MLEREAGKKRWVQVVAERVQAFALCPVEVRWTQPTACGFRLRRAMG